MGFYRLRKLANLTYPLRHFYLEDENISDPIESFLRKSDKNTLLITGEEGMGKFAAALNCAHRISDNVMAIADSKFSNSNDIGRVIAETIANSNKIEILIIRASIEVSYIARLASATKRIKPQLKIIAICSSVSEIGPSSHPNICLFSGFSHDRHFYRNFIIKYLGTFGKKATDSQIDKILAARLPLTPTILKIILNELIIFGSFELLDSKIDTLCSFADKKSLYGYLFKAGENKYGKYLIRTISKDLLEEDEVSVARFDDKHIWFTGSASVLRACASGFCGFDYYRGRIRFADNDFKETAKRLYSTG